MEITAGLIPGSPVQTRDHRRIGSLAGFDGERILVQPRFEAPYWLPDILVRDAAGPGVTLHLDHGRVKRYRQPVAGSGRAGRLQALRLSAVAVTSAVAWLTAFMV